MVGLRGRVLPTTNADVRLRAEMESGQILIGETSIVGRGLRIRRLSLEPSPRPLPDVLRALVNADGIVVGPGSLYTSIIPEPACRGRRVDHLWRQRGSDLRSEPDDGAGRNRSLHAWTITSTPSARTPASICSTTSSSIAAHSTPKRRLPTRLTARGRSKLRCRCCGQATPKSSNAILQSNTANARSDTNRCRWRVLCARW